MNEYHKLLCGATAFLGGDTGPSHLAISLNIPSVIIVGGGTYGCYFPYPNNIFPKIKDIEYVYVKMPCYGCDWKCNAKPRMACIHAISTAKVKKAFIKLFRNIGG